MNAARKNPTPKVEPWVPLTQAEVDALPPLPGPGPRGREAVGNAFTTQVRRPLDYQAAVGDEPSQLPGLPDGIGEDTTHAFLFHHPRQAAAVVRAHIHREGGGGSTGPLAGSTSQQVVAAFMIALGAEIGGRVLSFLHPDEVEYVVQAIASQAEITHAVGLHALEQVRQRVAAGDYVEVGGVEYARQLLEYAAGPYQAPLLLDRALRAPGSSGFCMLKNVAPAQIVPFISHEHPQTIALILSQLDSAQAAGILAQLPERLQSEVAYRIATMENIPPAVIKQIEESLEQSLRDILGGNQDVGGPKVVADILNLIGSSVEKNVLDQMDAADPEVAESVRNLMFTFADIVRLTDREIQVLLREVDQKDLVIALKATGEELKTKFLGNMSEQVRTFITEEMEFLGPMRLSEVEEVQLRIVQQVRQLEEQGQVTIVRGESVDCFV